MRILVISDSHGRVREIEKIIEKHPDIIHVFFLGDCVRDIEDLTYIYSDRIFHIAEGNCDGYTLYKSWDTVTVNKKKILFTHGHTFNVKLTTERLCEFAKNLSVELVLFGHTHLAITEYADGIHYVNPGSVSSGRAGFTSYAIVDLNDKGIVPNIIRI